jgi:CheY-like chemotaxis protein
MLLVEILNGMGHACDLETTEMGAVAAALRDPPELMIVDVGLVSGNGLSALRSILIAGPMAHVLISGDICHIEEEWPTSVVLQKPFREADLARAIQRARGALRSLINY